VQIEAFRHSETLRDEVSPDVVVVRLVEQRAVEIEQHSIYGRPIGPGMRMAGHTGVSYWPPMDATSESLVDFHACGSSPAPHSVSAHSMTRAERIHKQNLIVD
jgi:hypothetical protein